jgi:uncharacterized protein (TIGR02118 family)
MSQRLLFLLRRRPELSRDEFQRYWREVHAPLVTDRRGALGIRRYHQVHTIEGGGREGTVPGFDGIAELWFDASLRSGTVDDARRAGQDLLDDERRFIDLGESPIWMAEEIVLRTGATTGVRLTAALRRAAGISREEFRRHWREVHGPLALANPDVFGFRHYVQLHTPDDAESFAPALARRAPAPFDGVSEIWRDEATADPDRAASVRQMIMEDEARFVDFANSPLWLGRVEVVIDG